MLDISRQELARRANVAERTIADFEAGRRQPIQATIAAMRRALEAAGVKFLPENGSGAGVRLRNASKVGC